mgnify:FL=1
MLLICGQTSKLADMKKEKEMLLLRLERMLSDGELVPEGLTSLSDVCLDRLGVSPRELDVILLEELGVTGEEFFTEYGRKVIDNGNKFY